jgi:hypothetical protein
LVTPPAVLSRPGFAVRAVLFRLGFAARAVLFRLGFVARVLRLARKRRRRPALAG